MALATEMLDELGMKNMEIIYLEERKYQNLISILYLMKKRSRLIYRKM